MAGKGLEGALGEIIIERDKSFSPQFPFQHNLALQARISLIVDAVACKVTDPVVMGRGVVSVVSRCPADAEMWLKCVTLNISLSQACTTPAQLQSLQHNIQILFLNLYLSARTIVM